MKIHNIADHRPKKTPEGGKKKESGLYIRRMGKAINGKRILQSVSMELKQGEVVGLLGPNGAGKTTAFYTVIGLLAPDHGTIHMDGVDITHLPMYRRCRLGLGYLPQEPSIFRGLDVESNINAVLEFSQPDVRQRKLTLDSLLEEFSISHLRHSPVISLSGGERRRVEIARALASSPRYMLLDEPLAGIDPVAVNDICTLISHLKKRGIGIFLTDHNARETLSITDRAYILYNGQILVEGDPDTIVSDRDARRVYLGEYFRV